MLHNSRHFTKSKFHDIYTINKSIKFKIHCGINDTHSCHLYMHVVGGGQRHLTNIHNRPMNCILSGNWSRLRAAEVRHVYITLYEHNKHPPGYTCIYISASKHPSHDFARNKLPRVIQYIARSTQ